MIHGPVWVFLVLALCSCGTHLRAPLCQPGEYALPPGVAGRYLVGSMLPSAAYSNAPVKLQEVIYDLEEDDTKYTVATSTHGSSQLLSYAGSGRGSKRVSAPRSTAQEILLKLASCRIGDAYYAQVPEGNLFQIYRLDFSTSGVAIAPLNFVPEELQRAGFSYSFLPQLSKSVATSATSPFDFDPLEPAMLMIDNRHLSRDQRLRLIDLAHVGVEAFIFSRQAKLSARNFNPAFHLVLPRTKWE